MDQSSALLINHHTLLKLLWSYSQSYGFFCNTNSPYLTYLDQGSANVRAGFQAEFQIRAGSRVQIIFFSGSKKSGSKISGQGRPTGCRALIWMKEKSFVCILTAIPGLIASKFVGKSLIMLLIIKSIALKVL